MIVDPLAEMILNRDNSADPAETALLVLSMTSDNMYPPLEPTPPVFKTSLWQTRNEIRNGIWTAMERCFPDRQKGSGLDAIRTHESRLNRVNSWSHLMLLMRHDDNKSEYWGGPTAAGQMVFALDRLLKHLPRELVREALTKYLETLPK